MTAFIFRYLVHFVYAFLCVRFYLAAILQMRWLCHCFLYCIVHVHAPFTRKRIISPNFGRDVGARLGVAIFEISGPPAIFEISERPNLICSLLCVRKHAVANMLSGTYKAKK